MQWFRDIGLGIKISLILLIFMGILLISLISLLVFNTENLTQEVASERIVQELDILTNRLDEIQTSIESDMSFLIADITFFQAVGRRSQADIEQIIGRTELSSELFDVEIVDGDGNFLIDTVSGQTDEVDQTIANLLSNESLQSFITVEQIDGRQQISVSSTSPILSVTRNFLGAIRVSRQIDENLLQEITAQRDDVFVALIHNNRIITSNEQSTTDSVDRTALYGVKLDETAIQKAEDGETVVIHDLIMEENIPYKVAYAPVTSGDGRSPIILMLLVELSDLNAFQTETMKNTIIIFVVLTMITIVLIYMTLRILAIKPIKQLRSGAQQMVEGDYHQRIPAKAKDELGQLASTFNVMVNTIQERELSLREAREEAERANTVKSAFLASMSHELRTPLNAIINFSGFVADGDVGPVNEEQSQILGDVVSSAKHLLNLINDVLDMSKIEADSLQLFVVDDLNINELAQNVLPTARTLLVGKPVEIKVELDEGLPLMRGDKQRIMQVLLNLISNACKFTNEGQITIATKRRDDHILISVSDTGLGINSENYESIFQAFMQTEDGVRQGGGTGLGLPISRSLVEAHGGQLWVESELEKGSTFFLTLPLENQAVSV